MVSLALFRTWHLEITAQKQHHVHSKPKGFINLKKQVLIRISRTTMEVFAF